MSDHFSSPRAIASTRGSKPNQSELAAAAAAAPARGAERVGERDEDRRVDLRVLCFGLGISNIPS